MGSPWARAQCGCAQLQSSRHLLLCRLVAKAASSPDRGRPAPLAPGSPRRFGDVIHFGGGTRAPFEGLPVAGISSQFIYVFLEGVPEGDEEAWSALPRLEHAPPTPMNDSQRRNFLERQGLRLADGDHSREAAAMVRIVDDTVHGSRGSSPAASVPGEAGETVLPGPSPDGAPVPAAAHHAIQQQQQQQQPFGEGFALAHHQFGHGGMASFQPHVSAPMLQFRGGYHPMHPFAAGSYAGSGFRSIHPGLVGSHPMGPFSVGGYSTRQQLQPFEAAPRNPGQSQGAADGSAPAAAGEPSFPLGGPAAQWQGHTPTNRRAGAPSASPQPGSTSAAPPGSLARAPPGSALLNALLSSARAVRPRRGMDGEPLTGAAASEAPEPATAPAVVRRAGGDAATAGLKQQQVCGAGVRSMLAGLPGLVVQGSAQVPAAATPCVPQVVSGRRCAANGLPACATTSGSPHQLLGGAQAAFASRKDASPALADASGVPAPGGPAKGVVSLVAVAGADAAGWDASDAGCGAAAVRTARSTPLGPPVSAPAVVRPSAKRPCLASQRPSVAEAVQAELLALPAGWECAPASAPPQLRGDCHDGAMAPQRLPKGRTPGAAAQRRAPAARPALANARVADNAAALQSKAGSTSQLSDSPGVGASDFHRASRERRQRRALKRQRDSEAAAESVFAPEPQPHFSCGASLSQAIAESLGPGACSAVPASVLCSAVRLDVAGGGAQPEASVEAGLAGTVCQHTPMAHARSGLRSLGAAAALAHAPGHSLSGCDDLVQLGVAAGGGQCSARAAVHAALSCGLCSGLLVNAASLGCGHSFCFSCAAEVLLRHSASPSCPTCSAPAAAPGTRVLALADHSEVQALAREAGTAPPHTAAVEHLLRRVAALDVLVAASVAALGADARQAFSRRVGDHEAYAAKRGLCLSAHGGLVGAAEATIGASAAAAAAAAAASPAREHSAGGSSGDLGRSSLRCCVLGAGHPDDEVMAEEAASLRPLDRIASVADCGAGASHSHQANPDVESDDDESDDDEVDVALDPVSATFAFEDPAPTHALASYDPPMSNATSRASSDPGLVAAAV